MTEALAENDALFDLPAPEGVRLTARSLEVLDASLSLDRFEELLRGAGEAKTALSFVIGDLINYGDARYGERYAQALDATGLSYSTLSNYARVCRRVAPSRRRENLERWSRLRFSHFEAVASLDPPDQERWLDRAQESGWNRDELREAIRDAGQLAPRPPDAGREVSRPQEVLPVETVDAARNLSTVRETLERIGGGLQPETAEQVGILRALRAVDDAGALVRRAASVPLDLVEVARRVVQQATRSGGFAMIPVDVFDPLAAAVAATTTKGDE